MKQYKNTADFYNGEDWQYCKMQVTEDRLKKDGGLYCEHCGSLLTKTFNPKENNNKRAIVFHHKIYLTNDNLNDASISINPNNTHPYPNKHLFGISTKVLNKKTPIPEGCEDLVIDDENCMKCNNVDCSIRQNINFKKIEEEIKEEI